MIFTTDMIEPLINRVGWTQKEVAEFVGCTEQSICRWKKGRNSNKLRPEHRNNFIKLAKYADANKAKS